MDAVPLWPTLIWPLILIALTLLLTLMETAADSLSESRLEHLADEGESKARSILKRLDDCAGLGEGIQCARHMALLLLGFLSGMYMSRPLSNALLALPAMEGAPAALVHALCLIAVLLVLYTLVRLFCIEWARRVANMHVDSLILSLFSPMMFVRWLFRPMTALSSAVAGRLIRMSGADPEKAEENVTEDEILAMVDIGEEKGAIESSEKELIENVLEFNNTTAEDCMIHRTDVTAVDVDTSEEEFVDLVRETGFSRFPVYEDDIDSILGILTTRDYLLNARRPQGERKTIRELLRPAYFIPESVRADALFREMQNRKCHMAIVVDEYGGTSGLITLEDLLEELVGNIYDEFDPQAKADIIAQGDGTWRVNGSVELDRLCETIGIDEIESDEFDTLGGLIFSQLTAIPEDGSHPEVDCFGLHIRVEELTDHRVEWATVSKHPEEPDEDGEKSDKADKSDKQPDKKPEKSKKDE